MKKHTRRTRLAYDTEKHWHFDDMGRISLSADPDFQTPSQPHSSQEGRRPGRARGPPPSQSPLKELLWVPRSLTLAYTEMATHIVKKAPEGGPLAELISGFTRWASEAERQ